MPTVRKYQTNFSAGELTPRMGARIDTKAYQNGAKKLRNVRQQVQGGVMRRPGTRYVDTLPATSQTKLIEFAFNDEQSYVAVFQVGTLDVYKRDGTYTTGFTNCAWDTADKVESLRTTQNGDVMVVCHPEMPIQLIRRTGSASFAIEAWEWEVDDDTGEVWQPYFKYADAATTLETDDWRGSVTLTASAPVFVAGHVGQIVRHRKRQIEITGVSNGTTAQGTVLRDLRKDIDTGANLLEDGLFNRNEFWRLDPGWRITGGRLQPETEKYSVLRQEMQVNAGSSATLTFGVSGMTTGSLRVRYEGQLITIVTEDTSYSQSFTPDTASGFLRFEASHDFDGVLDNVGWDEGGTERVNEGTFDSSEYWIAEGRWGITNGKARCGPQIRYEARQEVLPELEEKYILTFDVSGYSQGDLKIKLDDEVLATITANGSQTVEFKTITKKGDLAFSADALWDGVIDNAELKMKPDNGPTPDWDEPAFSSVRGYPRVPYFHDQRLIFGGGRDVPNGFFASKPGAFFNFDDGEGRDDDGIAYTIAESKIAEIRAITSLRHLQVFTSEMELYVPIGEARPLTPANMMFKRQTTLGTSTVEPREFDGAVIFIPKSKASVREFVYSDIEQAYSSDVLSKLAQHLLDDPVDLDVSLESTYQPEQYAYIVLADGNMAVLLSERAEKITGWTLWSTQGLFKAVCNVADRMFVVVEREIDGVTTAFLEFFESSATLDCAIYQQSGSAQSTWAASHLVGQKVAVTSGNYYLGSVTVENDGSVPTAYLTTAVQIGIDYTPEIETLVPELQLDDGPSVGEKRRIVKAAAVLNDTLNVQLSHIQRTTDFHLRQVTDDLSVEPPKITGRQDFRLLGWSDDGTVRISQTVPLPFELLGLNIELEF